MNVYREYPFDRERSRRRGASSLPIFIIITMLMIYKKELNVEIFTNYLCIEKIGASVK